MAIIKTHTLTGTAGAAVNLATAGWDAKEGGVNAVYRAAGGITLPGSAFNTLDENLALTTDLYVFMSFVIPVLPTGSIAIIPVDAELADLSVVAQLQFRGTDFRLRTTNSVTGAAVTVATAPFSPVAGAEWCLQWHIAPGSQDVQVWKRATISGAPDWDSGPVAGGASAPVLLNTGQKTGSGFDWALTAMVLATTPFFTSAPPPPVTSRTHDIAGTAGQPVQFAAEGWDSHEGAVTALYVAGGPLDSQAMEFSGAFELFNDALNLTPGDDLYIEAIWTVPATPTDNVIAISAETAGGNLLGQLQIRPADVRLRDQNSAAVATSTVFPAPGSYVRAEWRIGNGTQKLRVWRNAVDFAGSPDYASADVAAGAGEPTLLRSGSKVAAVSAWRLNRLRWQVNAPFSGGTDPTQLKDHPHAGTVGAQITLAGEHYDSTQPTSGVTLPSYVAVPGSILPSMVRFPSGTALQLVDTLSSLHKYGARFYYRLPNKTQTAAVIPAVVQDATNANQAHVQIRPGLDFRIRDAASTAVDATAFAPVPGVIYLLEWYVDIDAATQTLKIWDTTDTEAGAPLDVLSGACGTAALARALFGKSTTAATDVDLGAINTGTVTPRGVSLLAGHQEAHYLWDGTGPLVGAVIEKLWTGSALVDVGLEAPTPPPPPPPPPPTGFEGQQVGKIYLGMSTDLDFNTKQSEIGHAVGCERIFQPNWLTKITAAHNAKRVPWISTKPDEFGTSGNGASDWSSIASGAHDPAIRTFWRGLANVAAPYVYTFAHEPSGGSSDSNAPAFVAAFLHILDIGLDETGLPHVLPAPVLEEFQLRQNSNDLHVWAPPALLARMAFFGMDAYQYDANGPAVLMSTRWPRAYQLLADQGFPDMMIGVGEHGSSNTFRQGGQFNNTTIPGNTGRPTAAQWLRDCLNYEFAHPEKFWLISYFNSDGRPGRAYWRLDEPMVTTGGGALDTETKMDVYRQKLSSATAAFLP